MAYNEKLADRTREIIALTHKNVEEKKMFGGLCFMVNDKMCVCVKADHIMVRIDPVKFDDALEQEGCKPMLHGGKIMKGFLFVDEAVLNTKKKLEYWLNLTLEYNEVVPASKKEKEMKYSLERSYEILDRTPAVLQALLSGLPDDWVMPNEGPETFSPYDVIGHLIHGEKTDWMVRAKMILEFGNSQTFVKWNRFAQYEESKGKSLLQLLDEFAAIRKENMGWFKSLNLKEEDLSRQGMHPVLGDVTLRHLLATWVVHDLTHISQITRVMAKQYKSEMGPWPQFFRILEF